MTRSPRYDRRGNEGGLDDGDKMGREDFEDWVLNRLSELGEIAVRPMFGGQEDLLAGFAFDRRAVGERPWGHLGRSCSRSL